MSKEKSEFGMNVKFSKFELESKQTDFLFEELIKG